MQPEHPDELQVPVMLEAVRIPKTNQESSVLPDVPPLKREKLALATIWLQRSRVLTHII